MTTSLLALDHLRIATGDLDTAKADYSCILGHAPLVEGRAGGRRTAVFGAGNVHVVLAEDRNASPGLCDACFRIDDAARFHRRLERLALRCEEAVGGDPLAALRASEGQAPRRLVGPAARGLGLTFIAAGPTENIGTPPSTTPGTGVTGLDHLVIASDDAIATAFLLGARLGLDLRMDLTNPDWGARLMFFRCDDLIVEVFCALGKEGPPGATHAADLYYGLSWRVADADAAREALAAENVDVSAVRSGRKPGTRVFTVRNRTSGVATLMLESAPRSRSRARTR